MSSSNHDWLWQRFVEVDASVAGGARALDFGCGEGRLLTWSRQRGLGDFHGVETFYGDGAVAMENGGGDDVPPETRARISVTAPGEPLPFADATFDFVCSNQVFEHVQDLEGTVAELARVTKPGGVQVHLFPTRERFVEGHLGVPLVHRLPPARRRAWARRWYPRVRFGDQTGSFDEWWAEMGPFLRDHTLYRTASEYDAVFGRYFRVRHVENAKLAFHLRHSRLRPLSRLAGSVPQQVELRRATSAVELTAPGADASPGTADAASLAPTRR